LEIDLGAALRTIYERSRHELSIDYGEDPPPQALSEADREWMKELVK